MRRIAKAVREAVIEDYKKGMRFTQIMKEHKLGSSSLSRIVKGIPSPPHGRAHVCRKLTIKEEKEMCERYRKGEPARVLAADYNCGIWAILNLLKEHGVPKRSMRDYPTTTRTREMISRAARKLWTERREEMLAHISKISFRAQGVLNIRLTKPALALLKPLVLNRDGHRCMRCGSVKDLQVHHKKTVTEFPELAMDLDNCETLCRTCHMRLEASMRQERRRLGLA